jgi:hypothetical protein
MGLIICCFNDRDEAKKHLTDCYFWLDVLANSANFSVHTAKMIKMLTLLSEVLHLEGIFGSEGTAPCSLSIHIIPKFIIVFRSFYAVKMFCYEDHEELESSEDQNRSDTKCDDSGFCRLLMENHYYGDPLSGESLSLT